MVGLLFALTCSALAQDFEVQLIPVITGVNGATDIQNAADGTGRLFVVQQDGAIRIWKDGVLLAEPFLQIRHKTTGEGEQGLLGLAFPPDYALKQRFYINYTDLRGDTIIAMYRAAGDIADPESETILLKIEQPFSNHNGGQIRFGPDGYLYIGMGDGGAGGDPFNNAQSLQSLLGKMLRIDVESVPGVINIPSDNPFASVEGVRPEIWATGLRNPWRFSFDRETHDLWIADVGQNTWEEVNFQAAASKGGENYGWNIFEGLHCYERLTCNEEGLVPPVAEYSHDTGGCSVTGGFVYRGQAFTALTGMYLYGDLCSGYIWGLRRVDDAWVNQRLLASEMFLTTFGEDEAGELYVADAAGGVIHRIGITQPVDVR